MRELGRSGATIAAVVAVLMTFAGATFPATATYYQNLYPSLDPKGPGVETALARAELRTSFSSETLTQYVPAVFTATIFYDRKLGGKTIRVAYENVASLDQRKGKFDIDPLTDMSQNLDEGTKLRGGGYKLSWKWSVTPKTAGRSQLQLQIQPKPLIGGVPRQGIQARNKPVIVSVKVNPSAAALKEVSSGARKLPVILPTTWVANQQQTVRAELPLQGHEHTVRPEVRLETGPSSEVRATISSLPGVVNNGRLSTEWLVTPTREGNLDLQFTTHLSTKAGEEDLSEEVSFSRSVTVLPKAESLWQRVVDSAQGIGVLLALLGGGGIIGLLNHFRKKRGDASTANNPQPAAPAEGADPAGPTSGKAPD